LFQAEWFNTKYLAIRPWFSLDPLKFKVLQIINLPCFHLVPNLNNMRNSPDIAKVNSLLLMFSAICFRKPVGTTKAMKLGSKSRDVESFVDQLKSEGENVVAPISTRAAPMLRVPVAVEKTEE
jgi:hypothetical protein